MMILALSSLGAGMEIISPSTQLRTIHARATIKDLPYWVDVMMLILFFFLRTKAAKMSMGFCYVP